VSDLRRDQPIPLYHQLEVQLQRAIFDGSFPNGRLPNEEDFVRQYRVSRMTVRAALRRLEENGVIERLRGRGTFVRPEAAAKITRYPARLLGFEEDLLRQGVLPDLEVLAVEDVEAPVAVARALNLEHGERALRVRRRGRVDGQPLWLEVRYCPSDLGARLRQHDLGVGSFHRLLEEVLGTSLAASRMRIEAVGATRQQARMLGVRSGHALLVSQAVLFDARDRPVSHTWAAFRGDHYAFGFELSPHEVGTAPIASRTRAERMIAC
jgi:GntR family transcriptional regulator